MTPPKQAPPRPQRPPSPNLPPSKNLRELAEERSQKASDAETEAERDPILEKKLEKFLKTAKPGYESEEHYGNIPSWIEANRQRKEVDDIIDAMVKQFLKGQKDEVSAEKAAALKKRAFEKYGYRSGQSGESSQAGGSSESGMTPLPGGLGDVIEIFEIDDETGQQVEIDRAGNPIPQTSSTTEPHPVQEEATEARYESPPPPRPASASYSQSPMVDSFDSPVDEMLYGDNLGQEPQFVPQDTQQREYQQQRNQRQRDYQQHHDILEQLRREQRRDEVRRAERLAREHERLERLRSEQRDDEVRLSETLARQREQLEQRHAQYRPQQHTEHHQAQAEQQFRNPISSGNRFPNNSYAGGGVGIGIGTSQGIPGLRGPPSRPITIPFSAAQYGHARARSFVPTPFVSSANRYNTPNRNHRIPSDAFQGQPTMSEQPGTRDHGENQHRGAEQEYGLSGTSDAPFSNTQNGEDPAHLSTDTRASRSSNENPTSR
ncbi:hypothetical protein BLS_009091 [Venturia inaequalis]|uniref:Uncharacterized protein n=1 Tax=Venturia inaequalis TaxID=5025 RepID=A0A8H3U5Q2_VENIN|nr:hypothetical protein BLS_009091 [Venturia inaequalis]